MKSRNILLTGGTGFVGQAVLRELTRHELNVMVLTSKTIQDNKNVHYICHRNYTYDVNVFGNSSIDVVIHIGASTPKGRGKDTVREYIENIRTTVHLIENLPNVPQKIIFISTVSVYKYCEIIDESTEINCEDTYGVTKILCEKYLEDYCKRNEVDLQILRLGPVFGPGEEKYNKVAGTFIRLAMHDEPINIFSDGEELRNMIYIDTVAKYITEAVLFEENIGIVNIVNTESISIKNLANLAVSVTNSNSKINILNKMDGRNDKFNSEKCRRIFGKYAKKVGYAEGMKQLYEYFKVNE